MICSTVKYCGNKDSKENLNTLFEKVQPKNAIESALCTPPAWANKDKSAIRTLGLCKKRVCENGQVFFFDENGEKQDLKIPCNQWRCVNNKSIYFDEFGYTNNTETNEMRTCGIKLCSPNHQLMEWDVQGVMRTIPDSKCDLEECDPSLKHFVRYDPQGRVSYLRDKKCAFSECVDGTVISYDHQGIRNKTDRDCRRLSDSLRCNPQTQTYDFKNRTGIFFDTGMQCDSELIGGGDGVNEGECTQVSNSIRIRNKLGQTFQTDLPCGVGGYINSDPVNPYKSENILFSNQTSVYCNPYTNKKVYMKNGGESLFTTEPCNGSVEFSQFPGIL